MTAPYCLIEDYNCLSEQDKETFKKIFQLVLDLEKKDKEIKNKEMIETLSSLLNEEGQPYFHVEYLKKILEIKKN